MAYPKCCICGKNRHQAWDHGLEAVWPFSRSAMVLMTDDINRWSAITSPPLSDWMNCWVRAYLDLYPNEKRVKWIGT